MKNRVFPFAILFVFSLFVGCAENKEETKSPVYHIDLKQKSEPSKIETFLSDMQIRLVPLETKDSIYFDGEASKIHMDGKSIFIVNASQNSIFRFNEQGEFIKKHSRQGQGPEEYSILFNIALSKGVIYGLDRKKVQLYDYDGNYIKTIPLKYEGRQIWAKEDGTVFISGNYTQPYQAAVYQKDGDVLEILPSNKNLLKLPISQSTNYSIGEYNNGVYLTNYFDRNIYQLEDSVSILATLDFGDMNISDNFFAGTVEEIEARFSDYRQNDKAVFKIDHLTLTDEWLIFTPTLFDPSVVYYNRKSNTYIVNKGFKEPYNLFFGKYNAPDGYIEETEEFYRLVNAMELKEMVEELTNQDSDYLSQYPFLKNVDVSKIDENTNDWILFFKL